MMTRFHHHAFRRLAVLLLAAGLAGSTPVAGQGKLTIGSGATVSLGDATLSTTLDWSNDGTFTPNTGTVALTGTTNQTIASANENGETFYHLIMNKPTGDVVLATNLAVTGTLTLTSGDLALSGYVVDLGTTGTLVETAGNTVKGTTGYLTATRTLGAHASTNVAGLGAAITTGSNAPGVTTIKRRHAVASVLEVGTPTTENGIARSFEVSPARNSGLGATLAFHYDESELDVDGSSGADFQETSLALFRLLEAGNIWIQYGGLPVVTDNTVTLGGIDAFSKWTLARRRSAPELIVITEGEVDERRGSLSAGQVNGLKKKLEEARSLLEKGNTAAAKKKLQEFIDQVESLRKSGKLVEADAAVLTALATSVMWEIDAPAASPALAASAEASASEQTAASPLTSASAAAAEALPEAFVLEANYPNPFNPSTEIRFALPEASHVRLVVYDMLGREVARLVEGSMAAGRHQVRFDASSLLSGVYLYRIEAGSFTQVRRMTLVK